MAFSAERPKTTRKKEEKSLLKERCEKDAADKKEQETAKTDEKAIGRRI